MVDILGRLPGGQNRRPCPQFAHVRRYDPTEDHQLAPSPQRQKGHPSRVTRFSENPTRSVDKIAKSGHSLTPGSEAKQLRADLFETEVRKMCDQIWLILH